MLHLRACVCTLLIVYPLFLLAGVMVYRWVIKQPLSPKLHPMQVKLLKPLRFLIFVVLMPLAITMALGVAGALDPLFFWIRDHFYS